MQTALRRREKIERYEADSISCKFVWKSKRSGRRAIDLQEEKRGSRESRRTGSGSTEKPACGLPAGTGRPANTRDPVHQALLR
ncbi:hypothetical protein ACLK17_05785 [Escherichia coli]